MGHQARPSALFMNILALMGLVVLFAISMSVGVADFAWWDLYHSPQEAWALLKTSRIPRSLALVLTGASMAIAGTIMQAVLKNRFVEPSMVGATQAAALGILVATIWMPALGILARMSVAALFSLVGMLGFLGLSRMVPRTDYLMLPLVGIVYGGVVDAGSLFLAHHYDLLQTIVVLSYGDFSGVIAGRYELLYLAGALAFISYAIANELTILGLGDTIAQNLGINYKTITAFAIVAVALISALVVITVGMIPFVGLVVPNIISRLLGDKLKKTLPMVAVFGGAFVLLCDILGRLIYYPYEIPVATIFGIGGAVVFLWLLLKEGN